jgi:pimeloyl-ACP methyl ester carboxylesterase
MSYDEMCEDVIAFSDDLGVDRAHLIGHSMGGKVAMTLALRYPDRVASLCVVDISPVDYSGTAMHMSIINASENMHCVCVLCVRACIDTYIHRVASVCVVDTALVDYSGTAMHMSIIDASEVFIFVCVVCVVSFVCVVCVRIIYIYIYI